MIDLFNICKLALDGIDNSQGIYTEERLLDALKHIIRPNVKEEEIRDSIIQVALELTSDLEPAWQYVAARLYVFKLYDKIRKNRDLKKEENLYGNLYGFISELTDKGLYG
ncbi:ribonucleoside-diphosphate reductase subunit alpha, partial [Clostridium perfringens]|nr:ribonucleoside-diphosphate reductase subunit alpha [Clostridium perfringens]